MVGDVSEEWLERQDVPVLDFSRRQQLHPSGDEGGSQREKLQH